MDRNSHITAAVASVGHHVSLFLVRMKPQIFLAQLQNIKKTLKASSLHLPITTKSFFSYVAAEQS